MDLLAMRILTKNDSYRLYKNEIHNTMISLLLTRVLRQAG